MKGSLINLKPYITDYTLLNITSEDFIQVPHSTNVDATNDDIRGFKS